MGYKVAAFNAMDSVPTLPSHQSLRQASTDLAREAAREIMRIYAGDHGVRDKADESPVTDADHAAEQSQCSFHSERSPFWAMLETAGQPLPAPGIRVTAV
jgi:hypothetical protein